MSRYCHVCGENEPTEVEALICGGCKFRLWRASWKPERELDEDRRELEIRQAVLDVLADPPKPIRKWLAELRRHRADSARRIGQPSGGAP